MPDVSALEAGVYNVAIEAAEESGYLPRGGVWGDLAMPDPSSGTCCIGASVRGPQYCTCWTEAFDAEQRPAVEGDPGCRDAMCADCAFRPGSPERQGDERYSADAELLDQLVETGTPFFCHIGIRRAARLVHPSGAEVELPDGDYRPVVVGGVPYKADGSPGDLCAGYAARRLKRLEREAAAS